MSNQTGSMQNGQFMPNSPTPEDILKALSGGGEGWDGINANPAGQSLNDGKLTADQELQKCFAQVYATPAGKRVIEAMMDQTVRRSPYLNNDPDSGLSFTLEQQTAYGLERKGQNGLMIWVLHMIHKGQNVKAAAKSKK